MKGPTPSLHFFSPISGHAPACPVARSTLGIAGKQGPVLNRFSCQGKKMSHMLSPVDCLGGPDSRWWWDLAHRYLALPWTWVHFTSIIFLLLLRSVQFNWNCCRFPKTNLHVNWLVVLIESHERSLQGQKLLLGYLFWLLVQSCQPSSLVLPIPTTNTTVHLI